MELKNDVRRLEDLKAYQRNSKTHPEEQLQALERSLLEFGWTLPLLISADGELITGHGMLAAAKRIRAQGGEIPGWPDTGLAPVVVNDSLTEAQRKAYRIADNRLAELGSLDRGIMLAELKDIQDLAADLDMGAMGVSDEELASLWGPEEPEGGKDLLVISGEDGWDTTQSIQHLRFGKYKVPLTAQELAGLENLAEGWLARNGVLHGFAAGVLLVRS